MSDIKIVQLKDKAGNSVTPYVSASAVYYQYTENGEVKQTNMETVYGGIDPNKILYAQNAAVSAITEQTSESVEKIRNEGDSYQDSIDELTAMIERIDTRAFPLEVETSFSGNTSGLTTSYAYNLTENGLPASGAIVTVSEEINGRTIPVVYHGSDAMHTIPSGMHPGTDIYKVSATKGNKSVEKNDVRHLWFYGTYEECPSGITGAEVVNAMNRMFTDKDLFDITMTTKTSRPYLWFVVPSDVVVESVTSEGVEVTLNEPQEEVSVTMNLETVSYRAYRNVKPLANNVTWNLSVKLA